MILSSCKPTSENVVPDITEAPAPVDISTFNWIIYGGNSFSMGSCAGPFLITSDKPAPFNITLYLSVGVSNDTTIFGDSACNEPITSIGLASGSNDLPGIYLKNLYSGASQNAVLAVSQSSELFAPTLTSLIVRFSSSFNIDSTNL